MNLSNRWQLQLDQLKAEGRYRTLTPPAGIDFSSNDYLGYSKRHWPGQRDDLSRSGTASRLLRGHHPIWDKVESKLAAWHGVEAVLMMSSGYAANEGLLGTLLEAGDLAFSDQCNHASLIDGLRLSKAERIIFRHNDLNELEVQMKRRAATRGARQAWFIVTESLFGMEGDVAPLRELAALAHLHDANLIVDEAHATGCFGKSGSGLVDAFGLRDRVLATVHTGGKALAVPGAYLAGSRLMKEMLVNRCRHLIYTTALPPQVGSWWLDTLDLVQVDDASRRVLQEHTRMFRARLASHGVTAWGADQIVPVLIGADKDAVRAADQLQERGFDVRAIRPPTVSEGTARLRISIHADHQKAQLHDLSELLVTLLPHSP